MAPECADLRGARGEACYRAGMRAWRTVLALLVLLVVATAAAQVSTRVSPQRHSLIEAAAGEDAPGTTSDGRVAPVAGAGLVALVEDDLSMALAAAAQTRIVFAAASGLGPSDGHRDRLERPPST